MMKDTKRRMEIFSFYDHTGVETHLKKMAADGWMLEKVNAFFWTYRRMEPKKLTFSVTYFPKASEFDPKLSDNQQTFVDFCEEAGWHLAATSAQMQIFYSEAEDPVPIETDAVTQAETIHQAMKRNFLPAHVLLLLVGLMQGGMLIWQLSNDLIHTLINSYSLWSCIPWTLLVILCLAEIITYFRWHKRSKIAAEEEGLFLATRSTRKLQYAALVLMGIFLLLWFVSLAPGIDRTIGVMAILYMVLLMGLVNLIKQVLKKKQVRKNINRTVTFAACFILSFFMILVLGYGVFRMDQAGWFEDDPITESYEHRGNTFYIYHDVLPLSLDDLMEVDSDIYSYRWAEESSFLLARYTARQTPTLDHLEEPDLEYILLDVKFSPLYGICKETLLSQYDDWNYYSSMEYSYVSCDPEPWQAEEVYQHYSGEEALPHYIVCWPDTFLQLSLDWEPTEEQMSTIAERLHPN